MKSVKFIIVAALSIFFTKSSLAQSHNHSEMSHSSTEKVKVWGNCEMCKARIEKAAKIEGVSKAEWNVETKILTLVYNPETVKSDDVQKKIASVGHDTEKFRADDKVYKDLPQCCKYERKE